MTKISCLLNLHTFNVTGCNELFIAVPVQTQETHSITVSHTPDERLKLRPSGVAGVGGDSQFNTEPTTGMYLKIPCSRVGD